MSLTEIFQSIANAIRTKTRNTEAIYPVNMAIEIEGIESGDNEEVVITAANNTLYSPIQDSDLCAYSITFSKS